MRRLINVVGVIFVALTFSACGEATQVIGPSPIEPPSGWTLTGQVVANPNGAPVSGATINLEGLGSVRASEAGMFSITIQSEPLSNSHLSVSAGGFVNRETWLRSGPSRDNATIDLISLAAPFSLDFYRQMVRNSLESSTLLPIRRHTNPPSFYVKTTDDKGVDIPQSEIDMIVSVIKRVVPQLTGGRFQATVEIGREKRHYGVGQFIAVDITSNPSFQHCGAGSMWGILLKYREVGCGCPKTGHKISPLVVAHEVGHSMGFWHHRYSGIMSGGSGFCEDVNFSLQELLIIGIAYSRPNGNTDPDNDPDNFQVARERSGEVVTSKCFLTSSRLN